MVSTKETTGSCMHHKGVKVHSRGICRACYMAFYRNLAEGNYTEQQAIRRKIILRCRPVGAPRSVMPFPKT